MSGTSMGASAMRFHERGHGGGHSCLQVRARAWCTRIWCRRCHLRSGRALHCQRQCARPHSHVQRLAQGWRPWSRVCYCACVLSCEELASRCIQAPRRSSCGAWEAVGCGGSALARMTTHWQIPRACGGTQRFGAGRRKRLRRLACSARLQGFARVCGPSHHLCECSAVSCTRAQPVGPPLTRSLCRRVGLGCC